MPGLIPVTAPEPLMVATDVLPLVQEMPGVVTSLTKVTEPVHTRSVPLIGAGTGFTVTVNILVQPVTGLVKVTPTVPSESPVT